jgi:magnesium transporter
MLIDANISSPAADHSGKLNKLTDTIERLHRRSARMNLQKVMRRVHPADLAHVLGAVPDQHVVPIYRQLPDKSVAASVFTEVNNRVRDLILSETPIEQLVEILEELPPDELTDLVQQLDPELADRVMAVLARDSKTELENLLQYAPETAGGIMTTDYFSLSGDVTVEHAIKAIRGEEDVEMIFYLYVTDTQGHLTGVVSLRQLLLAQPDQLLAEVMNTRVLQVPTDAKQEEVADLVDKYHLLALPVVDEANLLVGMVTVDDVIEIIENETTNEMLKMAGTDQSEILLQSPLKIAWVRLPWLLAAFVGGLAATGVIQQFEKILAQVLALSAFLPVIMGMAGNVGVQSATVAVRGLATGSLELRHIRSVLFKELRVGLLLGSFYGIVLGAFGLYVFSSPQLGEVVGLTILLNMTGAAALAILLPMFFHRIGTDPAVASGPFVTTAIDVLGVLNYFAIASLLLDVVR